MKRVKSKLQKSASWNAHASAELATNTWHLKKNEKYFYKINPKIIQQPSANSQKKKKKKKKNHVWWFQRAILLYITTMIKNEDKLKAKQRNAETYININTTTP